MVSKEETSVGRLVVSIRSSSNISANNCTRTSTSKYISSIKQEQVSAEYVQELLTRKRKAGSCEGPPRKRQKLSEHQSSSSCSSPQVKNPNTFPKVNTSKADFGAKYLQLKEIGKASNGSLYAGCRLKDTFPVIIKHITAPDAISEMKVHNITTEVSLMFKAAGGPESIGKFTALSLLDWYYLDKEIILVMERPVPFVNFKKYLVAKGGAIKEEEAKIYLKQLVDATVRMHHDDVFHRDIRPENMLVDGQRIRLMNFECGGSVQEISHRSFAGTFACAPPEWHVRGSYEAGPTTVWQLGVLLYHLLHGFKNSSFGILVGKMQLNSNSATQLSQDCLDFLQLCLVIYPEQRATLEQLQLHPWFTKSTLNQN
ncbi:serine/threonine-protein kinase pim-2-like [Scomber japonicus]|uniref:serine/threonine-protein kinase pim-2-like n=1 Tax=Scomber japonicus TaxID=13676 RepID=UPI002304FDF6|nr:serine/threonine-protein kinase pim-2-like [Scomber japonicus]